MNFETVSQKIDARKTLDFGGIINSSIALFKEVWLQGFIVVLLNFLCFIPLIVLFYIPLIIMGVTDPELIKSEDPPAILIIASALLMPLLMVGAMYVALTLTAGFYRICKHKDLKIVGTESYFYFFNTAYRGKILKLSFYSIGLSIVGLLACGIGLFYFIVPFALFPVFLAFDKELTALEIVKSSFALGNKHWFVIFGLLFVMGLLAELGVFLCFVGLLFTAMLSKIPAYYVYKKGVGFPAGSDEASNITTDF